MGNCFSSSRDPDKDNSDRIGNPNIDAVVSPTSPIKRIEAEKKLLLPENDHGAFLIRDSESRHNDYSLSDFE
ncbi:tyrosine-protein kinase Src42A isoform X4 [Vespula squamosa]|uniref:Tyrosine-protein kinase Src42A isoform X4 n=1 Tax=Vespula squamosa TaxID=30214 RepID=A0ABD2B1M8_VESSQ